MSKIVHLEEILNCHLVNSYGYNSAGRLTSEVRTGGAAYSRTYALDAVGNRTSQSVGGVSTSFSYNADDELTSNSGGLNNTYSYNANGERTNRSGNGVDHTLSYDYDGQLAQILQSTGTVSYAYDALGRRVSRTAGGTTTEFLFAGDKVMREKQGGTTTRTYTYGTALVRQDGETPLFDGQGSFGSCGRSVNPS